MKIRLIPQKTATDKFKQWRKQFPSTTDELPIFISACSFFDILKKTKLSHKERRQVVELLKILVEEDEE